MILIGIDCAAKKSAEKIGLAFGWCDGDIVRIEGAGAGLKWDVVVETLIDWFTPSQESGPMYYLVALDAPLGWPVALSPSIQCHKAGQALMYSLDDADQLFFRQTDREIISRYGWRPLAVGADKIARTAHAALGLLGELREKTGKDIELAWSPKILRTSQAIEVYPTATLIAHLGKDAAKGDTETKLSKIAHKFRFNESTKQKMLGDKNVFDAVLCVLAAADFVRGDVVCPTNYALAKKEGWIWVKKPDYALAKKEGWTWVKKPNQNHAAD